MNTFTQELLPLMPNLRGFAQSLCRNPDKADDLVQEALLKAWACRARYQPNSNLKAWLFTILRNHFYNDIRKSKNSIELRNDSAALEVGVREDQTSHLHFMDVAKEVAALSADHRQALQLTTVDGLSYIEAAKVCDCAIGTVKSRVARARRHLEKKFMDRDVAPLLAA